MSARTHTGSFVAVFVALMALVALTVIAAQLDLGRWNLTVALLIASIKALLIAMIFMHLAESRPLTRLVAGAGMVWLGILLTLTFADYLSR